MTWSIVTDDGARGLTGLCQVCRLGNSLLFTLSLKDKVASSESVTRQNQTFRAEDDEERNTTET